MFEKNQLTFPSIEESVNDDESQIVQIDSNQSFE